MELWALIKLYLDRWGCCLSRWGGGAVLAAWSCWYLSGLWCVSGYDAMLDLDGYRPNVGMVIFNRKGQVLWARRVRQNCWQFPQGGVKEDESEEQAMFRELYEEMGLGQHDVYIVQTSRHHYRYRIPKRMLTSHRDTLYQGQKQRWFLLTLDDDVELDAVIRFNRGRRPEFDGWRWVSYWYPVRNAVAFKRDVYRKILTEFAPAALGLELKANHGPSLGWTLPHRSSARAR